MVGSGAHFWSGLATTYVWLSEKVSSANELPSSPVVNCLFSR